MTVCKKCQQLNKIQVYKLPSYECFKYNINLLKIEHNRPYFGVYNVLSSSTMNNNNSKANRTIAIRSENKASSM